MPFYMLNIYHYDLCYSSALWSAGVASAEATTPSMSAQMPHDIGQSLPTTTGFCSHSPSCAHCGQLESLSAHASWHAPHVSGQSFTTLSGFSSHCWVPHMSQSVEL